MKISSFPPTLSASDSADLSRAEGPLYIGGQAVVEGVMMRAPRAMAVAVRCQDGSLRVRLRSVLERQSRWARLPFVRGVVSLVDSMRLGNEALRFSIEVSEAAASGPEKPAPRTQPTGVLSQALRLTLLASACTLLRLGEIGLSSPLEEAPATPAHASEKKSEGVAWPLLALPVLMLVALPQFLTASWNRLFSLGWSVQSMPFQILTGGMKLAFVLGYLLLLGRVQEIKRLFQYHGAEHKAVSTYEAGEPLQVAHAQAKTRLHPRCGTTFLVLVALVSIVVFSAVGVLFPRIHTGHTLLDNALFFLEKIPFLPLVAGLSFELQRLSLRVCTTSPFQCVLWPGFLVQKLTTSEPDPQQLEVALAALQASLVRSAEPAPSNGSSHMEEVCFPDYNAMILSSQERLATS